MVHRKKALNKKTNSLILSSNNGIKKTSLQNHSKSKNNKSGHKRNKNIKNKKKKKSKSNSSKQNFNLETLNSNNNASKDSNNSKKILWIISYFSWISLVITGWISIK